MISACFHKAQVPEKHEFSRFCRFSEQKSRRDFPLLLRKVGRSAAQGKLIHGGMTIMLSRNALGNLINRYAAVLKKMPSSERVRLACPGNHAGRGLIRGGHGL